MGLDCKICEGEREIPAWYVNDTEKNGHFCYNICSCTGKSDNRLGERKVSQKEYDCLKLEWAKLLQPPDISFQVAA
jgi:hypothetical protein